MTLFEPTYDTYPGLVPTGGSGRAAVVAYTGDGNDDGLPGSNDNPGNWIDEFIGPTYQTYPVPPPTTTTGGTSTSTPGGTSTPPATSTPASAPSSASSSPATTRQLLSVAPATAMPIAPQFQRAYCTNPVFHGERGEKAERKGPEEHVTREAEPVSFTVPAGCNAVDLWFGPIEPAPGARPQDFQHVIQTGKARVLDGDAGGELDETKLQPGQHLAILVPWRAAASTKLEAGRLRMAVIAYFFAVNAPTPQNQ